jgi:hypothetical protein
MFIIATMIFVGVGIYYISQIYNSPTSYPGNEVKPITTTVINESKSASSSINIIKIGIVKATFTGGAYNDAFYKFYGKYVTSKPSANINTDINLLTGIIPNHAVGNYALWYIPPMANQLKSILPSGRVTILSDESVHRGLIFYKNGTNAYDLLILGHQEYVTQKEYDNLKYFVNNGGKIIFLDGNVFYAEVRYNDTANTVTLVKGHAWKFDGKVAKRDVIERWYNETKEWVGGNFWTVPVGKKIYFTHNVFNYTHFEETYVNNPKDIIILDYGAYVPTAKIQTDIATYELNYGKGEVIVLGLYGENLVDNTTFIPFFKSLVREMVSHNL